MRQRTARGLQSIYRHPGKRVKTRAGVGSVPGVDIRGDGGYFVGPLSVHKSGAVYTELTPWTADLLKSAPVYDPAWLEPDVDHDPDPPLRSETYTPPTANPGSRAAQAARYLKAVPGTQSGDDASNRCYWLACQLLHGFGLDLASALPLMAEWGRRGDQIGRHGEYEPWCVDELKHKLESARGKPDPEGRPRGWRLRPEITADQLARLRKLFGTTPDGVTS